MARVGRALIGAGAALGILAAGSGAILPDRPPRPASLTLRFLTLNLLHGGIFSELPLGGSGIDRSAGRSRGGGG